MTTDTAPRSVLTVQGAIDTERWGSVGFKVGDPYAASECRRVATSLLERWQLTWVKDLVPDVALMVSELVANVQRHAGDAFHSGSFTLWHPNTWLILTVHDKAPMMPWADFSMPTPGIEDGRGLALVRALAAEHLGTLDMRKDMDGENPGKVMIVKMLLPDVSWPSTFRDPWTGKKVP